VATALAANTNVSGGIVTPTPTRAGDVIYWNGSTWVTLPGNNAGTLTLQENGSGVPTWASVAGTGTVTSITPGGGSVSSTTVNCSQSAITTAGTISNAECLNAQSGASYAIADSDRGKLITTTNAGAQAYTIAQAGTASNFFAGWYVDIVNNSTNTAGIVTITATTSQFNFNGVLSSTLKIYPSQDYRIVSDGTNYQVVQYNGGSGGWILLNTLTASNSATLTDTTSLTAAFSEYEIVFEDFISATNNTSCEIQIHASAAFQTTGYFYANIYGSGSVAASGNGTTFVPCGISASTSSTIPSHSVIRVNNPSTSAIHPWVGYTLTAGACGTLCVGNMAGYWNTAAVIDGFQVLMSAGNITSGKVKIYGRL
jgi:hypothetical protein